MVTNVELYTALGIPVLINAGLIGLLMAYINAKFEGMESRFKIIDARFEAVDRRFEEMERRFGDMDRRFDAINQRFDDMRDLWRAELHRVEEVLDARLKHLEERP